MEGPYRPLTEETKLHRLLISAAYRLAYPLLWLVIVPFYRLKVTGRRQIRNIGGAVTVMNHCLYMEWLFVCRAAWPRQPRFSMEEANIRRKDVGWANRLMGGFGIPDDHPMAVAPKIRVLLEKGELVHFFPEGYLKFRSQTPSEFLPGAAWFACMNNVPIIPIAEVLLSRGIHRAAPWWPPRVRLVIGSPLYPADYQTAGTRLRDRAARMTEDCERFIRETIAREGGDYNWPSDR
ncbi:MAG: lysophospholipid acyltransferase family protein [Spirochaetaceae bacterium]|nr:lysophospholipid acyltransferase family protein [Spirochaetaceae bacterium]